MIARRRVYDWVIRADTEELLFWNVLSGWGDLPHATIFTGRERRMMDPPKGGRWLTLPGVKV
ncbi:MAG: hypothetical protein LC749_22050 [Actinobacteria bacterium]|nr:hypothetical protein [Actinomycetota bacterium]